MNPHNILHNTQHLPPYLRPLSRSEVQPLVYLSFDSSRLFRPPVPDIPNTPALSSSARLLLTGRSASLWRVHSPRRPHSIAQGDRVISNRQARGRHPVRAAPRPSAAASYHSVQVSRRQHQPSPASRHQSHSRPAVSQPTDGTSHNQARHLTHSHCPVACISQRIQSAHWLRALFPVLEQVLPPVNTGQPSDGLRAVRPGERPSLGGGGVWAAAVCSSRQ